MRILTSSQPYGQKYAFNQLNHVKSSHGFIYLSCSCWFVFQTCWFLENDNRRIIVQMLDAPSRPHPPRELARRLMPQVCLHSQPLPLKLDHWLLHTSITMAGNIYLGLLDTIHLIATLTDFLCCFRQWCHVI